MFFSLGKYTARESHIDLNNDFINHGTLVAGIIKLKGPDNVEILNYKVKAILSFPLLRECTVKFVLQYKAMSSTNILFIHISLPLF